VAADVGFVARAAEGDAHVLAAERAGDRLRDRRLADARRAVNSRIGPFAIARALASRCVGDLAIIVADCSVLVVVARPRARAAWPDSPVSLTILLRHLLRAELAHGEELEHAVLHVLQPVVILVEHVSRASGRAGRRSARSTAARRSTRGTCG
jgi:hypothetical protein